MAGATVIAMPASIFPPQSRNQNFVVGQEKA